MNYLNKSNLSKELLDEFNIDDVDGPIRFFISYMGIENMYRICEELGGFNLYIPKAESLFRNPRNRMIRRDFNGSNYKDLAKKHKMTEVNIRNIINNKK